MNNLQKINPNKASLTPQKTFELKRVRSSFKIRDVSSTDEIKPNLIYCFAVCGLKPENFPSEELKITLYDWIIRKYSELEPVEIRVAFELAYDRKLNIQENDLNCYQDFSISFLSRIMSAYKIYRNNEIRKKLQTENKQLPMVKINDLQYLKSALIDKYNNILTGASYDFTKVDGYVLYNKLTALGMELCTPDKKQKIWMDVKKDLSWFEKTRKNMKPTSLQGQNETKNRIFKNWILEHVEFGTDILEEIKEYLND